MGDISPRTALGFIRPQDLQICRSSGAFKGSALQEFARAPRNPKAPEHGGQFAAAVQNVVAICRAFQECCLGGTKMAPTDSATTRLFERSGALAFVRFRRDKER